MLNNGRNITSLFSLAIGLILGYLNFSFINEIAHFIIRIFISILRFISLPIIFLSIYNATAKTKHGKVLTSVIKKAIKYTLFTTVCASAVAAMCYKIINPHVMSSTHVDMSYSIPAIDLSHILIKIIPDNIVQIFADSNITAISLTALIISFATVFLEDEKRNVIHNLFDGFFSLFMKIAEFSVTILPFILWTFAIDLVHNIQTKTISANLGYYFLTVVLANIIQATIVLPLFLKSHGVSPLASFRGMYPALLTAFFSKSSAATIPSSINCLVNRLRVKPQVCSVIIPLCTTINMNACAAFIYITVLFVGQSEGIAFGGIDYIIWFALSILAAIGNAGVPMGCFFMSSLYLGGIGASGQMMIAILPLYTFLDMLETAINVWSDSCITIIVGKKDTNK